MSAEGIFMSVNSLQSELLVVLQETDKRTIVIDVNKTNEIPMPSIYSSHTVLLCSQYNRLYISEICIKGVELQWKLNLYT